MEIIRETIRLCCFGREYLQLWELKGRKKGFEEKFGCEMGISVDDLFQIMFLFFVQLS